MDRPTQINIPPFSEVGDKKACSYCGVGRKVGELPAVIFQWSKVFARYMLGKNKCDYIWRKAGKGYDQTWFQNKIGANTV